MMTMRIGNETNSDNWYGFAAFDRLDSYAVLRKLIGSAIFNKFGGCAGFNTFNCYAVTDTVKIFLWEAIL